MSNLNDFNTTETCRACFSSKSDKFQSLFDSPNLMAMFTKCSYLKVEKDDGLPTKLCSACVIKCFSWFNFHELCRQTETLIKTMNKKNDSSGSVGGSKLTVKQSPINNNANENPIVISEDEETEENLYKNFIIYTDILLSSCESDNNKNTKYNNLQKDNNIAEIDAEQEIEEFILPIIKNINNTDEDNDFIVHNESSNGSSTSTKLLSCNLCDQQYANKTMLDNHIIKFHSNKYNHNKEKPFQCIICNRRFIKKSHFIEHTRRHTDETKVFM